MRPNDEPQPETQVEHSGPPLCYACFECGSEATTEHHVVPQSRGGVKTVPLCDECHGKAHGRRMATRDLTREALGRKRQAGERIGTVPFGKLLADDGVTLRDDAAEVRVIARMVQMRKQGMTFREISDRLNADGIPTKKRKGKWQHTTVRGIIRSA